MSQKILQLEAGQERARLLLGIAHSTSSLVWAHLWTTHSFSKTTPVYKNKGDKDIETDLQSVLEL